MYAMYPLASERIIQESIKVQYFSRFCFAGIFLGTAIRLVVGGLAILKLRHDFSEKVYARLRNEGEFEIEFSNKWLQAG